MAVNSPSDGPTRLDSWKEIAAFLGRDERTVNRWEKELGLPVHRLPGTKGRVYAFADELLAWRAAPRIAGAALPDKTPSSLPGPETSSARITIINAQHPVSDGGSSGALPQEATRT